MAAKRRFTRIPKVPDLIVRGVSVEAIPTYLALSDHASNKNGLCWPKMETLAKILGRSVRTVQRHLHLLKELGLVDFVQRRRNRGRFSSYLYRVVHFVELIRRKKRASTTGHQRPPGKGAPIISRTKQVNNPPQSPPKDPYRWWMGKDMQYHDKDLVEEDGQMKLLELPTERRRVAELSEESLEASVGHNHQRKAEEVSQKSLLSE